MGGRIEVSGHKSAWTVRGTAERFAEIEELWSVVTKGGMPDNLAAAHVQFPLAAMLQEEMGLIVDCAQSGSDITIRVRQYEARD